MAAFNAAIPSQYPQPGRHPLRARRCSRLVVGLRKNPHKGDPIDLACSDDYFFAPLTLNSGSFGVFDVQPAERGTRASATFASVRPYRRGSYWPGPKLTFTLLAPRFAISSRNTRSVSADSCPDSSNRDPPISEYNLCERGNAPAQLVENQDRSAGEVETRVGAHERQAHLPGQRCRSFANCFVICPVFRRARFRPSCVWSRAWCSLRQWWKTCLNASKSPIREGSPACLPRCPDASGAA